MQLRTQFLRFVLTGLAATLSTYTVLVFFVEVWHVNAIAASMIGYFMGIIVNYSLNYGFTFQSTGAHRVLIPKFLLVMLVGLSLNTGIMALGINWLGIHYALAQLAAIAVILVWGFSANRLWVFTD